MSSENPYESPQSPGGSSGRPRKSAGLIIAAVLVGLLILPASAIACFASCLAAAQAPMDIEAAFGVGGIVGVITFIAMTVGFVMLLRADRKRRML